MKDNISIIFTAIIGTILIVILPLISILDRQDSMAYNVVLTQTTKFVDDVRNNGFIDQNSYTNYLKSLTTTGNSYKVEMQIYRKTLINATDENGNIIPDTYLEEIELFNDKDVGEVLNAETSVTQNEYSNVKNNAYLLRANDEIYFKVYNTNITAGSVLYNVLSGANFRKVIDISYGGVVNNVNWELFNEIDATTVNMPEVIMEVPVNAKGKINVMKVTPEGLESIDCEGDYKEVCEDILRSETTDRYTYFYDLTYKENKEITIAVELKDVDSLVVGQDAAGNAITVRLSDMTPTKFNSIKQYLIDNYIYLNEMTADVDLVYRGKEENYMFDIVLSDVSLAYTDLLSTFATVTILPGLGQDMDGSLSLGAESVKLELQDYTKVHTITITEPINWKKLLQTKQVSKSTIKNEEVFVNQELAFIVSYTGIKEHTPEEIRASALNNLEINIADYDNFEILTPAEVLTKYKLDLNTRTTGRVIIKFTYSRENVAKENYVKIKTGWIETNLREDVEHYDETYGQLLDLAYGVTSVKYSILLDDKGPYAPKFKLDGIEGKNGWYIEDSVIVNAIPAKDDRMYRSGKLVTGGSGVYKNTIELSGQTIVAEKEIAEDLVINTEGTTTVVAKSYDYINNVTETSKIEIKLDKTKPTAPKVEIISGKQGENDWYTGNVTLKVTPGTDNVSEVDKTTYRIIGPNQTYETVIPKDGIITIGKSGTSTVYITTYDKAGNYNQVEKVIKIDQMEPAVITVSVTSGSSSYHKWYNTDVKVRIKVTDNNSPSGISKREYKIDDELSEDLDVAYTTFTEDPKYLDLTQSGKYTITANVYNNAGTMVSKDLKISIDKEKPNTPEIKVLSKPTGLDNWYTVLPVELEMISYGDQGPSGIQSFTYRLKKNGKYVNSTEQSTTSGQKMELKEDGKYVLTLKAYDYAANYSLAETSINIDTTKPTSGEFDIKGTKGKDGWYISDVSIDHTDASDATSGIKSVVLSHTSITSNTNSTIVKMTTTDKAGNVTEKTTEIKLDKTKPTNPTITLDKVTSTGIVGVNMYNKDVNVAIGAGVDDNIADTLYKVTTDDGANVVIDSNINQASKFVLTENGKYTITVTTYDKAGNSSSTSKVVWINKDKPEIPNIVSINEETITNQETQTVQGTISELSIVFDNLATGNILNITLIEQETLEKIEKTVTAEDVNETVLIQLEKYGTYKIIVKQTNIFNTEGDVSLGNYYYEYMNDTVEVLPEEPGEPTEGETENNN